MDPRGRLSVLPVGPFTGMAVLRLGAAGLIVALALARRALPGHPSLYALPLGLGLAAVVATAALVQLRRPASRSVAIASTVLDAAVASGITLADGSDPGAHDLFFGLALPVQAEAVMVLGLPGGLVVWAVTSGTHLGLEVSEGARGGGVAWTAAGLLVLLVVWALSRGLARERVRFRSLLEAVPDAVLVVDGEGRITLVNRAAVETFGYGREELVGKTVEALVPERLREVHARHREGYAVSPRPRPMGIGLELVGRRKDGGEFPAEISLSPATIGQESFVLALVRDVTERKRAEEALWQAQERYRVLVEQVPAAVYAAEFGEAGPWFYVSPQIERIVGFTPEEWMGDPTLWVSRLHPEDRDRVLAEVEHCRRTGEPLCSEHRMLAKDGRVVWVRNEATVVRDEAGRPLHYQGLLLDLTERKRAEEERRRLLHRLVSAQEEERARIASDIHDDPVQKMTAVGIRLATLRRAIDRTEQVMLLDQLEETVTLSIGSLRRLLFELRPPALDREGLAAALRQYLVEDASEAAFSFRLEDRLTEEPDPEIRVIAYRVAQEALANVRKHAQAKNVGILLESRDGGLRVRIRDDGVGFTPAEDACPSPGHLGLPSMRERVELAGGWWRVESAPGAGTTVEFWLPAGDAGDAPSPVGHTAVGSAGGSRAVPNGHRLPPRRSGPTIVDPALEGRPVPGRSP